MADLAGRESVPGRGSVFWASAGNVSDSDINDQAAMADPIRCKFRRLVAHFMGCTRSPDCSRLWRAVVALIAAQPVPSSRPVLSCQDLVLPPAAAKRLVN